MRRKCSRVVVPDSLHRFASVALVGLLVLAALLVPGCTRREAEHAVLECRFDLIEPYLGELTPDLVRAAQVGDTAPLRRALLGLGLNLSKVDTIFDGWHACVPAEPLPFPDAGVLSN